MTPRNMAAYSGTEFLENIDDNFSFYGKPPVDLSQYLLKVRPYGSVVFFIQ